MKTAIIALSAVFALSGVSMAASTTTPAKAMTGCIAVNPATGKKVKIDCAKTASINNATSEGKTSGPRLGIGVNPFVPGL